MIPRLVAPAALAALAMACFSSHPPEGDGSNVTCARAGAPPGPDSAFVVIRAFAFQPVRLDVPEGTTVIWVNCEEDGVTGHTSTAAGEWDSGTLSVGESFALQPGAGTWDYGCRPHPFMQGQVVVAAR